LGTTAAAGTVAAIVLTNSFLFISGNSLWKLKNPFYIKNYKPYQVK